MRIKSLNKLSFTTLILCSAIIGLAKSDFSLVFCAFLLLIEIIEFITRKKIDYQIIIFSIIVISFSQINIVECNLNPDSKDCLNYFEEKEEANIFNDDIVFNDSNNFTEEYDSLIDFDNERFAIYRFVLDSFDNIDHKFYLYHHV